VVNFSNRNDAFFWQDQISLTERLSLNVGGRLDHYVRHAHTDVWEEGHYPAAVRNWFATRPLTRTARAWSTLLPVASSSM